MKSRNFKSLLTLGLLSSLTLAACGADEGSDTASSAGSKEDYSIIMVTDVGGVDDKSFNQSAWEGMEAW